MNEELKTENKEEEYVESPERRGFMAAIIGAASAAYAASIGYVVFRYLTTGVQNTDLVQKIKVE
ncbi:MAG TPA: hypothetical protein V6C96_01840, partial [Vampirovibrionales bacterium]